MQEFFELMGNSSMQGLVLSPLIGLVLAVLFAGFTSSPSVNAPVSVVQTKIVYIERVTHVHNRSGSSRGGNNTDDGGAFLVGICLLVLFLVWGYALHAKEIHDYMFVSLVTLLAFGVTTILVSFINGQYTSYDWYAYTVVPVVVLAFCICLVSLARQSFSPVITDGALNTSFLNFYLNVLTPYGRGLVMSQLLGIIIVCIVMICTALTLLHYLSLMNQRSYGRMQGFWIYLTGITLLFSKRYWLYSGFFLVSIAYVLLEPRLAAKWFEGYFGYISLNLAWV